jgi:superfamily II DNA or RNA helicase
MILLQFISLLLGPIIYEDMSYDLLPKITCIQTSTELNVTPWDNIWSVITKLAKNKHALGIRYQLVKSLYERGRKVIAISSRLEQLESLAKRFPEKDTCIINSETPNKERTSLVKSKQLTFAVKLLGEEGLDDENLDTLVFLTPIGGDSTITTSGMGLLGNQLRQSMGRVLRNKSDNTVKEPEVYFFDEVKVDSLTMLTGQMQRFLSLNNFPYETQKLE